MTEDGADGSLDTTARLTGFMFLSNLMVPLLNWVLVFSRFSVADDAVATARNVVANPFLFRVNVVAELGTCVVVVGLAVGLYAMAESVSRSVALLALLLKLAEATLWAVIALGHLAALMLLSGRVSAQGLEPERLQGLVGSFLNVHLSTSAFPGVLTGLGLVLFLWLLLESRRVPRALAGFGVLSYALVFAYDLLVMIIWPEYSGIPAVQVAGWGPSVLFEVVMGFWLLVMGAVVPQARARGEPA